jgi:hypothetical protein
MNTKRTILMLSAVATFAGASMAAAQPNPGGRFAKMDSNGDGVVTLQEFEGRALAHFDKVDTNRDGKVTPEERKAAFEAFKAERAAKGERAERGPRGERGERGDKGPWAKRGEHRGPRGGHFDADKTFTKAELSAKLKEHFAKLDKNSDGKLTEDELKFGRRGHGPRGAYGKRAERT